MNSLKRCRVEDIHFLLECLEVNRTLSREGLENEYGLQIGRKLQQNIEEGHSDRWDDE